MERNGCTSMRETCVSRGVELSSALSAHGARKGKLWSSSDASVDRHTQWVHASVSCSCPVSCAAVDKRRCCMSARAFPTATMKRATECLRPLEPGIPPLLFMKLLNTAGHHYHCCGDIGTLRKYVHGTSLESCRRAFDTRARGG